MAAKAAMPAKQREPWKGASCLSLHWCQRNAWWTIVCLEQDCLFSTTFWLTSLQLLSDAFFKISFMSEAKHSSPPHRGKQMKQWIQPAAKACGNGCQQPMDAERLQQTRKGNADDLQPDVSFDLEIHGRKTEGLRKYEVRNSCWMWI